jgi:heme/copper-type cytochrome/quinol oxidase subunit 2
MADLSEGQISSIEDETFQLEFENEKDRRHYRKLVFYILGSMVIIMFICSFIGVYCYIFHINNIHQNTKIEGNKGIIFLLSLTLTIPTILSLAIMRFLFGNNTEKDEKNIPSIIFNIGKELKETLVTFINKKS